MGDGVDQAKRAQVPADTLAFSCHCSLRRGKVPIAPRVTGPHLVEEPPANGVTKALCGRADLGLGHWQVGSSLAPNSCGPRN